MKNPLSLLLIAENARVETYMRFLSRGAGCDYVHVFTLTHKTAKAVCAGGKVAR